MKRAMLEALAALRDDFAGMSGWMLAAALGLGVGGAIAAAVFLS